MNFECSKIVRWPKNKQVLHEMKIKLEPKSGTQRQRIPKAEPLKMAFVEDSLKYGSKKI